MKRSYLRQITLMLLPAILVFVLFLILGKWLSQGEVWANSVYNRSVYSDGVIRRAVLLDRNNRELATVIKGEIRYNEDPMLREATVHSIGDNGQHIATGAVYLHRRDLVGYSPIEGTVPAEKNGGAFVLSIDGTLNRIAYEAMGGRSGAVAVCDYTTGEILCMVSSPSFDPAEDHPELGHSQQGEYLNRFTDGRYVPGSIFKLITAAAALETIEDIEDYTYQCEGSCILGGNEVKCAVKHGKVSLEDALAVSCNCCFAQLAVRLGADTLGGYADRYGLLDPILLDSLETAAGNYNAMTTDTAEIAWSGIGQAKDLINPASFLRFLTAIPNGGEARELSLTFGGSGETATIMEETTAESLRSMMSYDVAKTYGIYNFPGLALCAKSGTAEVGGDMAPHSWFVGFLDDPEHPYAFVVIVENGGWGISSAGKIANKVLQAAVKS